MGLGKTDTTSTVHTVLNPKDYPFTPLRDAAVIYPENKITPLKEQHLEETSNKIALVGYGSNRNIESLRSKLGESITFEDPVVLVNTSLSGVELGHCAHVDERGYIPAAPYHSLESTLDVAVLYLTDDQLSILDAHQKRYRRVSLDTGVYALDGFQKWHIYVSQSGVLSHRGTRMSMSSAEILHSTLPSVYKSALKESDSALKNRDLAGYLEDYWKVNGMACSDGLVLS